jgi:hypothetical protein
VSSQSIIIRDQIVSRLQAATALAPYGKIRKTPLPQAQPSDLPILSVFVMNEQSSRDGEGYPQFERNITIGISVVRGFEDPVTLDGEIDGDIALIENTLLTDPTFVGKTPQGYFESVEGMTCRRLFPQVAETYVCELRLEMTFKTRVDFDPIVVDDFKKMVVDTKPLDTSDNTPLIRSEYDQDID